MTTPEGIIILENPGYFAIDHGAALSALPKALREGPRHRVVVDLQDVQRRAIASRDWQEAAHVTTTLFREQVQPVLDEHPGHCVGYFGTVSIPLALRLGFLLSTWRSVRVFQHHHRHKNWVWPDSDASGPAPRIDFSKLPNERSLAEGDLVVRVSTSHTVAPALTQEVIPRPLFEVDIRTDPVHEDALTSPSIVEAVAEEFKRILDKLHELFPNARTVHLFAACPVGLALKLGTRISPTIHPAVQTYEFDSKAAPKYYPAIVLQAESAPALVLSDEERALATGERALWREELTRIREFGHAMSERSNWLDDVLPEQMRAPFGGTWRTLPRLRDVDCFSTSDIDLEKTAAPGGFTYFRERRAWVLGDDLLVPIIRRIPDEEARRRAARLFLLHEGLHEYQRLTASTAPQIGRFPKVLEEVDYQADVWAQLHERQLTEHAGNAISDNAALARDIIRIAMETMFAFDDIEPSTDMQVRRVARYLIWAWQYLRTERFDLGGGVWTIFAEKPVIELAGPEIQTRRNRVWYLLDRPRTNEPELALYWQNTLHRYGTGPASPLEEVLGALRSRDGERLRAALRGVFDLVMLSTRRTEEDLR